MPTEAIFVLVLASLVVLVADRVGLLDRLGSRRAEAIKRLTFGLLWWIIASIVVAIWFVIGAFVFLIDIGWQLIFGSEGIGGSNVFADAWDWYTMNVKWVLWGEGSLDFVPFV